MRFYEDYRSQGQWVPTLLVKELHNIFVYLHNWG
jgi:hypothetical protein